MEFALLVIDYIQALYVTAYLEEATEMTYRTLLCGNISPLSSTVIMSARKWY